MTKHEANAALCRALGVEPKPITCGCYAMQVMCDCAIPYPDLTSADALMPALLAHDERGFQLFSRFAWVPSDQRQLRMTVRLPHETHGHMLFRAACAAFGIQYEETTTK